ncbi:EamA family transporter [Stieleria sp. ICT_E10.1]|uniref:EamA family transporter n=1 Tax=Stieleria sedimenti TaxID=2976331 RepID=UPI0021801D8E|nr:EamA family transporter [Stieleria sedimenti]MCS7466954.1 EamA family transporter [Stieleria sedimenti]
MNWILLSIVSAVLLGVYDAAKKWSVQANAVPIVLLVSVSIGAVLYLPLLVWSTFWRETIPFDSFVVGPLSWREHGLIASKSVLVGASWTFAFSALKHLPLSIAAPIRATSPFWTIVIAILFFGERPTPLQWTGIVIVLIGFWRFTLVGRREGIRFTRNRWVALMTAATLLGACSSIYDKWLLQTAGFDPVTMQAWFTIDLVPVMVPLAIWWHRFDAPKRSAGSQRPPAAVGGRTSQPFQWRWSIALVSPLLILADWFYFVALSDPEALVSVVSVVRRSSVVIALGFGAKALSEANFRAKSACVAVILLGVVLLTWHG